MRYVTRKDVRAIRALLNGIKSKQAAITKVGLEKAVNRSTPIDSDVEKYLEQGRKVMESAQISNPSLWTSVFFECSVILEYSMTTGISPDLKDKLRQVYDRIIGMPVGGPEFLTRASREINSIYALLFKRDRNLYRRNTRYNNHVNPKDIQTFRKFRKERIDLLKALSIIDAWRRDARGESRFHGNELQITGDRLNHAERMKIASLHINAITQDLHVSVVNFITTMMTRISNAEPSLTLRNDGAMTEAFLLTHDLLNPHHGDTRKLYDHLDHLDLLLEKIGVNKI